MARRRPRFEPVSKEVVDTSTEYVEAEMVEDGFEFYCTVAGLEDQDNAPTTISFGKRIGDQFIPFEEEPSPAAGVTYHTERTHRFVPGEIPTFRVEGGTSGDQLSGYLEGYLEAI